ncbi:Aste57867_4523 [Aphanomyces stellatus]|uniref:Aste57867_4523 protein n=1 Tax=Aphanomyces stellatus TaxID=120398 RepID=A0A485KBJ3_9STRA|nr:hypothetical protein As57867_004510 [Aphanomyces stellatus]VFT81633.1 Aste57867_4523 [Aphanomyces stellatus]
MQTRSFTGNGCLIPQGSVIASNTLVGVFSKPPENPPLKAGESCFGLPPIIMPTRRNVTHDYDAALLFHPSWPLYCQRLIVEGIRILLPPVLVSLGIAAAPTTSSPLPMYYLGYVIPGILLTLVLKWTLVGTYKPVEWPMWSSQVWWSEFITSVMEHLGPIALAPFIGTPYLPMIYRLYGANIGRRCYVGVLDIPEFDCVHIGDDCAFNATSFPQTHLFEDRVMKLGHVHVGNRCTMRLNATLLPQSTMEDDTALGCNSVAMKGEHLTSGYDWYGFPVDIRKASTKEDGDLQLDNVMIIQGKVDQSNYTALETSRCLTSSN